MHANSRMIEGDSGEQCPRCGALVAKTTDLCPACGALLAAYRAAETVATPAALVPVQAQRVPPSRKPNVDIRPDDRLMSPELPVGVELRSARAAFLTMLSTHERQLMTVINPNASLPETSSAPTLNPIQLPAPGVRPAPMTSTSAISKPLRPVRASGPARTGRPGYIASSPVEPALLTGVALLTIAVGLVVCASLTSLRAVAIAAFGFGVIGIFATVIAVLAMLIQRDRRRD